MEPFQLLSRAESPSRCPICLEYHSADTATLMPCGHTYDVSCLAVHLKMLGELSRQCALCRSKFAYVKYAFTPDGDFKIHIPGKGDEDENPFLRDDEVIPPGTSDAERKRKLDLRRLRAFEAFSRSFSFTYGGAANVEDNNLISISYSLHLKISQSSDDEGMGTSCTLKRTLELLSRKFETSEESPIPLPPPSGWRPEKITEAREFIKLRLDSMSLSRPWATVTINEPKNVVLCDARGLGAVVDRLLNVGRRFWSESIIIQESVTIKEVFFSELPAEEDSADEVIYGIGKTEREKALKMARQELQGVMECLSKVPVFAADWKELDRKITGIHEEVVEEDLECQYCEERHRNGDCRLPNPEDMESEDNEDSERDEEQ